MWSLQCSLPVLPTGSSGSAMIRKEWVWTKRRRMRGGGYCLKKLMVFMLPWWKTNRDGFNSTLFFLHTFFFWYSSVHTGDSYFPQLKAIWTKHVWFANSIYCGYICDHIISVHILTMLVLFLNQSTLLDLHPPGDLATAHGSSFCPSGIDPV